MANDDKTARAKVTIISGKGVSQTINYLLEDRDELEWVVAASAENKSGEIFFYDTGGDIVEDLGTLKYRSSASSAPILGTSLNRLDGDEPE